MSRLGPRAGGGPADAGYSVLEIAIVLPVAFFLLMLLAQAAVVWHARNVTQAAAREGLRTAEGYTATAAAGRADTLTYLGQVAPHALPDPQVSVIRTSRTATVRVTARVLDVLPFGDFHVTETVSGPVERFVTAP